MPFFLPSLKKSGRLDNISITLCIVGSRKLTEYGEDYGKMWRSFFSDITVYGFDADARACEKMNHELAVQNLSEYEEHIPFAVWKSVGQETLYLTSDPACSSLLPPSQNYIERFIGNSELIKVMSTTEVNTTTLDEVFGDDSRNDIDFLQMDVQGGEVNILAGAKQILSRSILAILTEVEFIPIYDNQPLFSDIDIALRNHGFSLFDIMSLHRDYRRNGPLVSKYHPGQLVWGDAFYFRDLIRSDINQHMRTPDRIFKLACIADGMNFTDYAMELLVYLTTRYGEDKQYNFAKNIMESLNQVPEETKRYILTLPVFQTIRHLASY